MNRIAEKFNKIKEILISEENQSTRVSGKDTEETRTKIMQMRLLIKKPSATPQ